VTLSLESHLAGVTGPCPVCRSPVTAPSLQTAPPEGAFNRGETFRKGPSRCGKGRVIADSAIDYQHLDRRESFRILRIFLLFVLVFCACLLVTWFMKDWMSY